MPIVPQSIPALHGGVSQQAAAVRNPIQCEEAINCDFSIARGVSKRPPLEIYNELSSTDMSDAFFFYTRTDFDRWFLVVVPGDGTYSVYDADNGNKLAATNDSAQAYLTTAGTASEDFFAVGIDNKVYIVNRTIDTTMLGAVTAGSLAGTAQTLQDSALSGAAAGSIWHILGEQGMESEGYYVKESSGKFFEWVKPGITYQFDATTMPHIVEIFYDAIDPFGATADFTAETWEDRKVGDLDSNEEPSFIGNPIDSIFFKSDRLGVLSKQSFSLSEVGTYTNFWRTSVVDVLDDDRIDNKVNAFEVSQLYFAESVGTSLVLFANERQFTVEGAPVFSPATLKVNPVTAYPSSKVCRPVSSGSSVYFISDAGEFSHLREMFIQPDTLTLGAANVASHADHYIPANIRVMAAHPQMDHILMATPDDPGALYSYQFYWAGEEKALSAWGRWEIAAGAKVVAIRAIGSAFHVVYTYAGKTYIGKFNLKYGDSHEGLTHKIYLDHLQKVTANYNGGENRTYFSCIFPMAKQTVPGTFDFDPYLVRGLGWDTPGSFERPDQTWPWTRVSDNQFYVNGDWTGLGTEEWWVGLGYEQAFTFSEQYYVENNRSQLNVRVQLRTMTVHFSDTGYFQTRIKVRGHDSVTAEVVPELTSGYTARTVGDDYFQLNAPQLESGTFQFPVFSRASDAQIELVNAGPLPSNFQAAEWKALISRRGTR